MDDWFVLMLDYLISHLPRFLLIPAVRLFMPKLYWLLRSANVTQQGDKTLLTWKDKGHIVVDDSSILMLGTENK